MSNTTVIPHRSICFARSHSNWGHITAARLRESGASDVDEPGTRRTCARRVSRGLRRSTAVVIVIVRNRSCDTTAAATVQRCGSSGSQAPAPSVALAGSRGALAVRNRLCDTTAAATVQHRGHSSSQAPAPSVALAGNRGALAAMDLGGMVNWRIALRRGTTAAATVQHRDRSSSQAPAPSVALAGSRGALAVMDRR